VSGPPETQCPGGPEPGEPGNDADQAARDRELLDFLIEQTWIAYLQKRRTQRER
jgi:hypothetical protein